MRTTPTSDDEAPPRRIPFTILTGFLGAGKTTALNRVLAAGRAQRTAILVNDVGRVNVDRALIKAREGDILELSGGCVCCQVDLQRNLWDGVVDLARRTRPERIVLETTGIAEPAELVRQLRRDPTRTASLRTSSTLPDELRAVNPRTHLRLAGVVCVVDGEAGAPELARHPEARAQVVAADRLLLSKLDIASPEAVLATHAALDPLNATAERASFAHDEAGDQALTDWLLAPARRIARPAPVVVDDEEAFAAAPPPDDDGDDDDDDDFSIDSNEHDHLHAPHAHGQLAVLTISDEATWLEGPLWSVVERFRPELVRVKGWVRLAGSDGRRAFVELAGARAEIRRDAAGPGRTELVFIGSFDPAALERQLAACRAR
jgi:G3E family GTPase